MRIRKYLLCGLIVVSFASLSMRMDAKNNKKQNTAPEYIFTTVKANPITSIKNQMLSGTCWCFSTNSFLESEVMRMKNITDTTDFPDFSEAFVIGKSYRERAIKSVRLEGKFNFGAGSESEDVVDVVRDYGIVPQSAQPGAKYNKLFGPMRMDSKLAKYVKKISKSAKKASDTTWIAGVDQILQTYLGASPDTFSVAGVTYTPSSYRDYLGIDPNNYISFTSYTHHPFYTEFPLEVPDNWRWDNLYNIPIDEFMAIIDSSIMKGYTVAWGADVTEPGFSYYGVAVLPKGTSASQAARQSTFNDKTTTDYHGMLIYGIAKDQNGNKFYMVKNSWGKSGDYKGIWYFSEDYVRLKTTSMMVNKDVLTPEISHKLGL